MLALEAVLPVAGQVLKSAVRQVRRSVLYFLVSVREPVQLSAVLSAVSAAVFWVASLLTAFQDFLIFPQMIIL